MAVRIACAAAVLAAAVVVYALLLVRRYRELRRLLARERASHGLMTGLLVRDFELCRARLDAAVAQERVAAAAGRVLDEALSTHHHRTPPTEGGPR